MGKIIQNGIIYTGTGSGGGGGASSVDQLTDVQLTSPTTGDELVYNSSLTSPYKWENKKLTWTGTQAQYDLIATPDPDVTYYITDSDTGNYGINDLADVNITSAANGQLLTYDEANSVWKNKAPSNRPVAYIKFSGTSSPLDWGTSVTSYSTYTLTDIYGNTLTFGDLVDSSGNVVYDVYFIYTETSNSFQYVFPATMDFRYNSPIQVSLYSSTMIAGKTFQVCLENGGNSISCLMYPYIYQSKTASSGGTALSAVTTGEKYIWDNKQNALSVVDASSNVTLHANFASPDYKKLYKYGNVCQLAVRVKVNTAISDNSSIVTLPTGYAPKINDSGFIAYTGTQYVPTTCFQAYFGWGTTTIKNLGTLNAGTYVNINYTYII